MKIFARVDSLVTQGNTAVVLDRGQTSVTTISASGNDADHALRAGEGATTMAADPAGRVLVADTRGDELLVFGTDPLILRQRYPGARRAVRAGRLVDAGLGVANRGQHRGWLRSGHRNPRREGALSNRAATELPGLRRRIGHLVRDLRVREAGVQVIETRGRHHDRRPRTMPNRLGQRPVRRIRVDSVAPATGRDTSHRIHPLSIEAEYRGWELTQVRLYTDGSRRVLLRRKKISRQVA